MILDNTIQIKSGRVTNNFHKKFLNDFAQKATGSPQTDQRGKIFNKTFDQLARSFPDGLKTRKGMTPVNLFEAVAVGAALALIEKPSLALTSQTEWVHSAEMRALTTGPTNSRPRVTGRIEFCRDRFLGLPMHV